MSTEFVSEPRRSYRRATERRSAKSFYQEAYKLRKARSFSSRAVQAWTGVESLPCFRRARWSTEGLALHGLEALPQARPLCCRPTVASSENHVYGTRLRSNMLRQLADTPEIKSCSMEVALLRCLPEGKPSATMQSHVTRVLSAAVHVRQ